MGKVNFAYLYILKSYPSEWFYVVRIFFYYLDLTEEITINNQGEFLFEL